MLINIIIWINHKFENVYDWTEQHRMSSISKKKKKKNQPIY
jgi:hypothetical protein